MRKWQRERYFQIDFYLFDIDESIFPVHKRGANQTIPLNHKLIAIMIIDDCFDWDNIKAKWVFWKTLHEHDSLFLFLFGLKVDLLLGQTTNYEYFEVYELDLQEM